MDETPKRFDRIVSILIQLQSKRIVKAHELALRFEVSLRTIYRDIRTLEASGVPLYSEAGIGYSLMDGYRLPPVMFTREEASSFIAAEKLMQKFTDKELAKHYTSAAIKLKAVLQLPDKEWISSIESNILMQPRSNMFGEESPNALAMLFKSIAEKMQVTVSYQPSDASQTTSRMIEPVGIFHDHDNWYTLAYCHLRKDYRQFRTDRIHKIDMTGDSFTKEHPPLEALLKKDKKEVPTTKVRILVEKKIANYLEYEKKYHGFVSEKHVGDHIEMSFLSPNIEDAFCRWYLMYGDCATILEPERLKVRVLELIKATELKLSQTVG